VRKIAFYLCPKPHILAVTANKNWIILAQISRNQTSANRESARINAKRKHWRSFVLISGSRIFAEKAQSSL
jgi:hypothetical protein